MSRPQRISPALRQAAQAGDPQAMHKLGLAHEDAGHKEEAVFWFNRAAAAGDPAANTQIGLWHISGRTGPPDAEKGFHQIKDAASHGHLVAQRLVATLYAAGTGTGRDWGKALSWIIRAAKAGDAAALTQVAVLLPDIPRLSLLRQTLLYAAASAGLDSAAHQLGLMMLASDDVTRQKAGLGWIKAASDAGNPASLAALERHVGNLMTRPSPLQQVKRIPWMDLRRLIRLPHEDSLPPSRELRAAPKVQLTPGFLPAHLLDYMIGAGHKHLSRATVNDSVKGEVEDASRSNSYMNFRLLEADLVTQSVNERIMKAMGVDPCHGDPLSLLHYLPGQSYLPHYDFFDPDFPAHAPSLKQSGQRPKTALVYLNDEYQGGETRFHELELLIKGARGDLLIFDNVTDDGQPDKRSLHSGESPTAGEKWILSKWARTKPTSLVD